MQLRKRAKSVTFGRKIKTEETEPEVVELTTVEPKESGIIEKNNGETQVIESPEIIETKTEHEEEPAIANDTPMKIEETESLPAHLGNEPENLPSSVVTSPEEVITPVTEPEYPQVQPISTTPEELSAPLTESSRQQPLSAFTIQGKDTSFGDNKKSRFGWYFVIVSIVSFLFGLGIMATISYSGMIHFPSSLNKITQKITQLQTNPSPTITPTQKQTATPTEKVLDLKAYTITVLNGSGVAGKAAEVQSTLNTAGYKVIKVGNADAKDYTLTKIEVKKAVDQAFVTQLENELKKTYTVDTPATASSSSTNTSDVTIIIGSKLTTK
jgi:hypothetical protein